MSSPVVQPTGGPGFVHKVATYAAGSVVATVCTELALVVCYGLLHVGAGAAAVIAWFAGAVPNYWVNRSWTWQRSGRPSLRREVVPYVVIVVATLLVAVAATHAVSVGLRDRSDATRTAWVAITYLGVFVGMSLVRFVLFDRLFDTLRRADRGAASRTEETAS